MPLIASHPKAISCLGFGDSSEWFITASDSGVLRRWELSHYSVDYEVPSPTKTTDTSNMTRADCIVLSSQDGTPSTITGWTDGNIRCFHQVRHSRPGLQAGLLPSPSLPRPRPLPVALSPSPSPSPSLSLSLSPSPSPSPLPSPSPSNSNPSLTPAPTPTLPTAQEDGQLLWQMNGAHRGGVTCVSLTPLYLVSAGADGAIRIWSDGEPRPP